MTSGSLGSPPRPRPWIASAALAAAALLGFWVWGVPPLETLALAAATAALGWLPGWALTAPVASSLETWERSILATITGLVATGIVHYLWNVYVAGHPFAPGTGAALLGWCAIAAGLTARETATGTERQPRGDGTTSRGAMLALILFVAPIPALLPFATPNGRIEADGISFDMDEYTHFNLVGTMLRPGRPTVPTLAGYPMPPYQFLTPSLSAAFIRFTSADPIRLHCRWFPVLAFGLCCSGTFVLARRMLASTEAAVVAALALVYAGDPFTSWGLVNQIHSAFAYVTLVAALIFLQMGLRSPAAEAQPISRSRHDPVLEAGAGTFSLTLSGFLLATLLQSKAPLFFSCAAGLAALVAYAWLTRNDRRPGIALTALIVSAAVLGADRWGSVRHSPLALAPGAGFADALSQLPAPWNALGASRWLAVPIGLVAVAVGIATFKSMSLPWALAMMRRRPGNWPWPALMLLFTTGAGLSATLLVREPANPGSIVSVWFVQHPLLIASQLACGAVLGRWLTGGGASKTARRWACLLIPGLAVTLGLAWNLGAGEDPPTFERAELACGAWLRHHSAPGAVVLHQPSRQGIPMFSLRASVLSLEPILEGQKPNAIAPPEYMSRLYAEVARRREDLTAFFTTRDARLGRTLAHRYAAAYLFLAPSDPIGLDPVEAFGDPVASCEGGGRVFAIQSSSVP